jgi:hypothetical protein
MDNDLRPTAAAFSLVHHTQVSVGGDALKIVSERCGEIDATQ